AHDIPPSQRDRRRLRAIVDARPLFCHCSGGRMIRPGSRERSLRADILIVGDFLVAWASLAAAVYIRRGVPLAFTRSLLPAVNLPLDTRIVLLFGVAFVSALGLAGFYRRRIMLRARPVFIVAVLIQIAIVTIGATIFERPLPRTIL